MQRRRPVWDRADSKRIAPMRGQDGERWAAVAHLPSDHSALRLAAQRAAADPARPSTSPCRCCRAHPSGCGRCRRRRGWKMIGPRRERPLRPAVALQPPRCSWRFLRRRSGEVRHCDPGACRLHDLRTPRWAPISYPHCLARSSFTSRLLSEAAYPALPSHKSGPSRVHGNAAGALNPHWNNQAPPCGHAA